MAKGCFGFFRSESSRARQQELLVPLDTALMIPSDHEGTDFMTLPHTPHLEYQLLCDNGWHRLCTLSDGRRWYGDAASNRLKQYA